MIRYPLRAVAVAAFAAAALTATQASAQLSGEFKAKIQTAEDYIAGKMAPNAPPVAYTGDPIELRFSSFISEAAKAIWNPNKAAFDQLERESGGKLKIKLFAGGVLHKANQGITAVRDGISDISHCYVGYQPKSFEVLHMMGLPGIFPDSPTAGIAQNALYPKYFKKEYEAVGVYQVRSNSTPQYNIISKEPVRTIKDLDGLKVRTTGGVQRDLIEAVGGVSVFVPITEAYTAFQRGTVDSVVGHDAAFVTFRTAEVAKYHTNLEFAGVDLNYCINQKVYDNLPADLQKVFYNWTQRWNQVDAQLWYEKAAFGARTKMKEEMGIEFISIDPAERTRIIDAMDKVTDALVAELEGKGFPAKQILADMKAASQKYGAMTWNEIFMSVYNDPLPGLMGK
ncbi:MAG: TRAP transporter substrate-binding protein DctP [Alphaproteobacteria bacterium]|jgi:TRAP-type C4-dicarboxylate transport system substrate-binding protein